MGLNVLLLKVIKKDDYDANNTETNFDYHASVIDDDYMKLRLMPLFENFVGTESNQYYDFDNVLKRRGKDIKDYTLYSNSGNRYDYVLNTELEAARKENRPIHQRYKVSIKTNSKTPTYTCLDNVLYTVELYDQRRGANDQFYSDGQWDTGGYITTAEELEYHYLTYFAPEHINGDNFDHWSRTDYDGFKTNILDKFVEGEMIVVYW